MVQYSKMAECSVTSTWVLGTCPQGIGPLHAYLLSHSVTCEQQVLKSDAQINKWGNKIYKFTKPELRLFDWSDAKRMIPQSKMGDISTGLN
jgi:hypothetical protein